MKSIRLIALGCGGAAIAMAALVLPAAAQAGGHISWSVGISGGAPVYRAPAPVYAQPYVQPQPIYVQPQPVYVQPRPIYVQPQSVYVGPSPYYGGTVVGAPPVYVQPQAVYPIDWAPRGHHRRHRHHERGPYWRY